MNFGAPISIYCSGSIPINKVREWLPPTPSNSSESDTEALALGQLEGQPIDVASHSFDLVKRRLEDQSDKLDATRKANSDLDDHDDGLHIEYYLEALQNPALHTVTIPNVTLAAYFQVLDKLREDPSIKPIAKHCYFPDSQELVVMSPLPVHEQVLQHLDRVFYEYVRCIKYDHDAIQVVILLNSRTYTESSFSIPDFQLIIRKRANLELDDQLVKWVGECIFSADRKQTVRKLAKLTSDVPSIDLIFIALIIEQKYHAPVQDSDTAMDLRKKGRMKLREFSPARPSKTHFGPVVVGGIYWINVTEVRLEIYQRGPDGAFDFNEVGPSACCATGTLHPSMQMDAVDRMFQSAANHLKTNIVTLMRDAGISASRTKRVTKSKSKVMFQWKHLQEDLSASVYYTAHARYLDWYDERYKKRKRDVGSGEMDVPPTPSTSPGVGWNVESLDKRLKLTS